MTADIPAIQVSRNSSCAYSASAVSPFFQINENVGKKKKDYAENDGNARGCESCASHTTCNGNGTYNARVLNKPIAHAERSEGRQKKIVEMYRTGVLMSSIETPTFSVVTSRGIPDALLPPCLRQVRNVQIVSSPLGEVQQMNAAFKTKNTVFCDNAADIKMNVRSNSGVEARGNAPSELCPLASSLFSSSLSSLNPSSFPYDTYGFIRHLTFRDALRIESVFGGASTLQVATCGGRKDVNVSGFMESLNAFKPHIFTCPGEECTVSSSSAPKRLNRAVEKTLFFQNEIIQKLQQMHLQYSPTSTAPPSSSNGSSSSSSGCSTVCSHSPPVSEDHFIFPSAFTPPYSSEAVSPPFMLCNLQGGGNREQRVRAIQKLLSSMLFPPQCSRCSSASPSSFSCSFSPPSLSSKTDASWSLKWPHIGGVSIGGFGYEERLSVRGELLMETTRALPTGFPRFLPLNFGSPIEILQAVYLGTDVFECAAPLIAAEKGIAFVFDTDIMVHDCSDSNHRHGCICGLINCHRCKAEDTLTPASDEKKRRRGSCDLLKEGSSFSNGKKYVCFSKDGETGSEKRGKQVGGINEADVEREKKGEGKEQKPATIVFPTSTEKANQDNEGTKERKKQEEREETEEEKNKEKYLKNEVEKLLLSKNVDDLGGVRQINLHDEKYSDDFSKLSNNTPVEESRAYIHHLLVCKEMLGVSLLVSHNLHVYSSFFESIRMNIQKNTFLKFAYWFCNTQTSTALNRHETGITSMEGNLDKCNEKKRGKNDWKSRNGSMLGL